MSVCQVNTLQLLKSERSPVDNPHKLLFCATFTFSKNHLFPKGPKNVTSIVGTWDHFFGVQTSESSSDGIFGSHLRFTQSLQALALFLVQLLLRLVLWFWFFERPNHFRCNFSIKQSCKKRMRKVGHQKAQPSLGFLTVALGHFHD